MIKIEEARAMAEKVVEDKANELKKAVDAWLDEEVTEEITKAAKAGRRNVSVAYHKGMGEGQKAYAMAKLREEGYEVDPFYIATLEIKF